MASHNEKLITYMGQTHNITGWARKFDMPCHTLARRLARGMPIGEALHKPRTPGPVKIKVLTPAGELGAHELAKAAGVTVWTIYRRHAEGWANDELGAPRMQRAPITANGETKTVREWARSSGLRKDTIYDRLRNGWSPERAVTVPAFNPGERRETQITAWGRTQSIKKWSKETGIGVATIGYRLKTGMSPELALKIPTGRKIEEDKPQPLTPRQQEIADRVAQGWLNKEIARDLGLSTRTVQEHLRQIFMRAGVGNRTELAIKVVADRQTLPHAGSGLLGSKPDPAFQSP